MKFVLVLLMVVVMLVPAMVGETAPSEYTVVVAYAAWNDEGWNQAHADAWEKVKVMGRVISEGEYGFVTELTNGTVLRVVYITNCGEGADIEPMIRSAIMAHKPDMVYATWWTAKDAVRTLAEEFPKVKFNHCSGFPVLTSAQFPETNNVSTYFVRMYYEDYKIGKLTVYMGLDTPTGMVGTHTIPEPVRGANAYQLGKDRACVEMDCESQPTMILWIKEWLDVEKETLATETLLGMGYKLIKQGADTPTTARVASAEGAEDVTVLGYGRDTLPYGDKTLATNEWAWYKFCLESVMAGIEGTWEPNDYWEIGTKMVYSDQVSQEIRDKVEATPLDEVWAGPFSGYGYDLDGNLYHWSVPVGETLLDKDLLEMQIYVDKIETGEHIQAEKFRFAVD